MTKLLPFILFASLLLGGVAEAEPVFTCKGADCTRAVLERQAWMAQRAAKAEQVGGPLRVTVSDMPRCETKMRAVMKRADSYLFSPSLIGQTAEYCDEVCQAERDLANAKRWADFRRQWQEVMKECVQ